MALRLVGCFAVAAAVLPYSGAVDQSICSTASPGDACDSLLQKEADVAEYITHTHAASRKKPGHYSGADKQTQLTSSAAKHSKADQAEPRGANGKMAAIMKKAVPGSLSSRFTRFWIAVPAFILLIGIVLQYQMPAPVRNMFRKKYGSLEEEALLIQEPLKDSDEDKLVQDEPEEPPAPEPVYEGGRHPGMTPRTGRFAESRDTPRPVVSGKPGGVPCTPRGAPTLRQGTPCTPREAASLMAASGSSAALHPSVARALLQDEVEDGPVAIKAQRRNAEADVTQDEASFCGDCAVQDATSPKVDGNNASAEEEEPKAEEWAFTKMYAAMSSHWLSQPQQSSDAARPEFMR